MANLPVVHLYLVMFGDTKVLVPAEVMARIEVDGRAFVHAPESIQTSISLLDVTVDIFRQLQLRIDIFQIPG